MYCEHCFVVSPSSSTRCIQCGKVFVEEKPKPKAGSLTKKSNDDFGRYAGFAGLAVGFYSGIFVLLMMAGYFATSWLCKKFINSKAILYIQTIAIQSSLVLIPAAFMAYGHTKGLLPLTVDFIVFDISLPILGLVWLIKKPSLNPLIALTIFQLIVLSVNFINIFEMDIGSQNHKALSNYIVWRIGAIYFMWSAYLDKNNDTQNVETTS